jgi:CRP/FNR family transcriptional regulator, cyclic AMP receptor protein
VGASREMISRVFKDLSTGGYIELAKDRILIAKTLPGHW